MGNAPTSAPATAPFSFCLKPLVAALAMAFGMTAGENAHAATFTVVNLNDTGAGSLRHAIAVANVTPGADTITFDPSVTGTITLTTGELSITDSVTLQGPGPNVLTIMGNNVSPVLDIPQPPGTLEVTVSGLTISGGLGINGGGISVRDAALTLDNVVLSGNGALQKGGGLFADGFRLTLTVRNSIITGNTAWDGGGIYVEDTQGPTLIQNTTISNNTATNHGGGIFFYDPDNNVTIEGSTISGNVAGQRGGGIYLYSQDNGSFTIRNSTISGNRAANGGGIFLFDVDHPTSIVNTTISGNTATGDGGGLNVDQISPSMDLVHVTITNNTAGGRGGGFKLNSGGGAALTNVIVAGNQAGTGALGNAGTENDLYCPGPFSINNSLIQDGASTRVLVNCLFGYSFATHKTLTNVAPLLGPLQNNGGSTLTHALLSGSPAINAGIINSGVSSLTADQRGSGFPRIVGALPDMGAFELPIPVLPPPNSAGTAQAIPTLSPLALALLAGILGFAARRRPNPDREPP